MFLFLEKVLNKETAKDISIKSNKLLIKLNKGIILLKPSLKNQAIVKDEIKALTPAWLYLPRIQRNIFQKNKTQGIEETLKKDKLLKFKPLS